MLSILKTELLQYLRKEVENSSIEIKTKRIEQDEDEKPYTVKEKLEYFKRKNPDFEVLVKKFGLDPEF